ncbi:MAG: MFS transporter [Oscillospiraceae bacterium]|nr:MFS transporter [Oscillospiraceae bacterium]
MNKRNIFLLCAIGLLQGMVFYAPVATLYRQTAGLGIWEISLIESISLALSIALEIPWGITADRIGYRKTMVVCCMLFFLSKILLWKASGFGGFLLERILLAVVCSGLSGVDVGMLYESCGQENSHKIFGIYEYLQQAGLLLAATAYSLWIGTDYRLAGFLTVLSYGAAALLALFLQEVKAPQTRRLTVKESAMMLAQLLTDRKLLLFLLGIGLLNETHQTVTVFLNQLQYTRSGMTVQGISWAYILLSLAGLTSVFSFRLTGRMGEKRMGNSLMFGSFLCCLVLVITEDPAFSVAAVVGLRVCYSLFQPLQLQQQNRRVQTRHRATVLSMHAVFLNSIAVVLNLLYGRAAETGLPAAMLLGAAVCLVALLLYRKGC